jgi:hypothetical protein
MSTEFCPECHQPISHVVAGVRLTAFKAELFHFIESHPGQSWIELAQHFGKGPHTVKAHIYQINDALMNTTVRIRGRQWSGYHVEKTRAAE